jgi:manganese efflux pump family protein
MEVAALITWVITALGGFVLLGTWISRGGTRQGAGDAAASRFPPGLIFGHFLLAATGLVLWIVYLVTDSSALAWVCFAILLVVALLGFTMFARWLQVRRASVAAGGQVSAGPPEQHFPVPVVILHGLLAATTLVLVLLAALGAS